MAHLLLLLAIVGTSLAAPRSLHPQWEEFKVAFGKSYATPAEELRRAAIFSDNMRFIDEHNERFQRGEKSFELGMSGFTDQSEEDDAAINAVRPAPAFSAPFHKSQQANRNFDLGVYEFKGDFKKLAKEVDWRAKNAVTPPKMQGECGACYAFAALGAMESHLAIKSGALLDLSEQQILECPHNHTFDGEPPMQNHGCNGGEYWFSYEDIAAEGGIVAEDAYPYLHMYYRQEKQPPMARCHLDKSKVVATATGMRRILTKDAMLKVPTMMAALQHQGPLVVMLHSFLKDFKNLRGNGIYDNPSCPQDWPTHMVVIVGYGTDAATGVDYWIIKNSWGWPGQPWGDKGFARIRRGTNVCGIEVMPAFPLVKKL